MTALPLRAKNGKWLTGSLAKAAGQDDQHMYDVIMSTVPMGKKSDAVTLSDFGYQYMTVDHDPATAAGGDAAGAQQQRTVLRTVKDPSQGFQWLGQKHYDLLGNAIVNEIYTRMESPPYGLKRVMVPLSPAEEEAVARGEGIPACGVLGSAATLVAPAASSSTAVDSGPSPQTTTTTTAAAKCARTEPQIPIFMSNNALQCDTLCLVMQGTGAVRPGMWARALCMNESLEAGTIFSYVAKALAHGWGVVVTNPNENTVAAVDAAQASDAGPSMDSETYWLGTQDTAWKAFARQVAGKAEAVRGSETSQAHSQYVYETIAMRSTAKRVVIVAHSFGGICVGSLFRDQPDTIGRHLLRHCAAVAFTDACNDVTLRDSDAVRAYYKKKVINWVGSKKPLDAPLGRHKLSGCEERSAGHAAHEWTSSCCVEPVFAWLEEKLAASLAVDDKKL